MNTFRAFAILALVSCAHSATSTLPTDAVRVLPAAEYARWWGDVEFCSGKQRDMASIEWYIVPGAYDFAQDGHVFAGSYTAPNRIVLADMASDLAPIVRHEILHALLPAGSGHPAEYFVSKCGAIVAPADSP